MERKTRSTLPGALTEGDTALVINTIENGGFGYEVGDVNFRKIQEFLYGLNKRRYPDPKKRSNKAASYITQVMIQKGTLAKKNNSFYVVKEKVA